MKRTKNKECGVTSAPSTSVSAAKQPFPVSFSGSDGESGVRDGARSFVFVKTIALSCETTEEKREDKDVSNSNRSVGTK